MCNSVQEPTVSTLEKFASLFSTTGGLKWPHGGCFSTKELVNTTNQRGRDREGRGGEQGGLGGEERGQGRSGEARGEDRLILRVIDQQ